MSTNKRYARGGSLSTDPTNPFLTKKRKGMTTSQVISDVSLGLNPTNISGYIKRPTELDISPAARFGHLRAPAVVDDRISTADRSKMTKVPAAPTFSGGQRAPLQAPAGGRQKSTLWNTVGTNLANNYQEYIPYASNLVNAVRRPMRPVFPNLTNPVYSPRVSYNAQRVEAARQVRGANMNADRTLDPQSAGSLRAANLTQGIRSVNQINEAEANANAQIARGDVMANAQIEANNNALVREYNDANVNRSIAIQREQSENLANAADKYMMQQQEKARAKLDLDKMKVMSKVWEQSGVFDRIVKQFEKEGLDDYTGIISQFPNLLKNKQMGGEMNTFLNPREQAALLREQYKRNQSKVKKLANLKKVY